MAAKTIMTFFLSCLCIFLFIFLPYFSYSFSTTDSKPSPSAAYCSSHSIRIRDICLFGFSGLQSKGNKISYSKSKDNPKNFNFNKFLVLFLILSGDIELSPGPSDSYICLSQFNSQSVFPNPNFDKPLILKQMIHDTEIDIFCLCETWIDSEALATIMNSVTPENYTFVHEPRVSGQGGGVGFILRSSFNFTRLQLPIFSSFEIVGIKINFQSISYIFINIYRLPSSLLSTFFEEFSSLLEDIATSSSDVFITGDFNIHVDNPENNYSNTLMTILETFGMIQYISFPTHIHGHTLDLFISNSNPCSLSNFTSTVMPFSDHFLISSIIKIPSSNHRPKCTNKTFRNFKNFDVSGFCNEILNCGINYVSNIPLDLYINAFYSTFTQILDKYAPVKTVRCSFRKHLPFYTREIRLQKRLRSRFEAAWRRCRSPENYNRYKNQAILVAKLLRQEKRKFFRNLVSVNNKCPKKLWDVLNQVTDRQEKKVLPRAISDVSLASQFSNFFIEKIRNLGTKFANDIDPPRTTLSPHSRPSRTPNSMSTFEPASEEEVKQAILSSSNASCFLDFMPTDKLKLCLPVLIKPITVLVNKCLSQGEFPEKFKVAIVKPLLKKFNLPKEDLNSYRPVSNLSFISKLLEKIVHSRLMDY